MLTEHIDATNYRRTLSYLTSFVSYFHKSDTLTALEISHQEYLHFEEFPNALRIALFLDESKYVYQVFKSCNDLLQKEQLCFILAQHGIDFLLDEEIVAEDDDRGALQDIIYNAKLSEGYLYLARDIEVMEPKYPEDVYKVDSIHHWAAGLFVDSNMQNLAATYVNAFVNAGFGQDTLMTVPSENLDCGSTGSWVFKNKDHGKASAAASLGMIFLWNFDSGRAQINKYIHSNDNYVVAGALLGSGIVNCNVTNDNDTVLSLLADYVHNEDSSVRIGAIMGLGLAYAGSQNELIQEKLSSVLKDRRAPIDVIAFTAISLGLVFVGSCNIPVADSIISSIACLSDEELGQPMSHLPPVGLGLIYLGKKVQISLDDCTPHSEDAHQCPAVLGIAMVAMAEEVGLEMAIRSLEHLLQYGEHNIRQTVPLALGLLCISNPKIKVIDTLSKLSHDKDSEVLMRAIISLGLIGAGTNNARIARILRKLLRLYYKEPQFVFCVQIAQGLLEMGKGLLTLNPYHSERFLLSKTALAGIITFLHACLDNMACILGKYHYIIYFLVLAIKPRMLITVDEKLKPLAVPVRVGQAVDVVGMPGRPKTITGFQTHLTPVILGAGKRAELATEEYIPLTPILEGFVILKKNPAYGD